MTARAGRRRAVQHWVRRLSLPAYAVSEAARLVGVHRTTVSDWYYPRAGARGSRPRRVLAQRQRGVGLSYLDLVEVAFVATLRDMGVTLRRIRIARDHLEREFGVDYPFSRLRLKTEGTHIFYDLQRARPANGEPDLVEASSDGQLGWAEPIQDRLDQFDYDLQLALAIRWFPRGRSFGVVVDPQIEFGTPILVDTSTPTWVIRERYLAREDLASIGHDFAIDVPLVRRALDFERETKALAA